MPPRIRNGLEQAAGAGLGLSIVAAVTEAHGGTVDARSAEGKGVTFRIELPLLVKMRQLTSNSK